MLGVTMRGSLMARLILPVVVFARYSVRGAEGAAAFVITGSGVEIGDASSGTLVSDDQCVTDGVGNYANNEQATITVGPDGGKLFTKGLFEIFGAPYHYLTIQGSTLGGTMLPTNIVLAAGATFTWTSDWVGYKDGFTICICDTSVSYRTIAGEACTTYTQTTCPAGHWGDVNTATCISCDGTVDPSSVLAPAGSTAASACTCAAGSWYDSTASPNAMCISCDAALGKMPTGVVGASTEAAACKLSAFRIVGTGVQFGDASSGALVLDEQCVTDGVGKYSPSEQATITAIGAGKLYSKGLFQLSETSADCKYAKVTVKGSDYCGTTPPGNLALSAGETFTWWTTNKLEALKEGFTLCLCDTSVSYTVASMTACTQYTLTTCPIGNWGGRGDVELRLV